MKTNLSVILPVKLTLKSKHVAEFGICAIYKLQITYLFLSTNGFTKYLQGGFVQGVGSCQILEKAYFSPPTLTNFLFDTVQGQVNNRLFNDH